MGSLVSDQGGDQGVIRRWLGGWLCIGRCISYRPAVYWLCTGCLLLMSRSCGSSVLAMYQLYVTSPYLVPDGHTTSAQPIHNTRMASTQPACNLCTQHS